MSYSVEKPRNYTAYVSRVTVTLGRLKPSYLLHWHYRILQHLHPLILLFSKITMTKVAAIQMVSGDQVESNLRQAEELIDEAASQGAKFALLPEYFPIISDNEKAKLDIVEDFGNGPLQQWLGEQAQKHDIWLMAGTVPLRTGDPGLVASGCLLCSPAGECTARYDKMHLFDVCVSREDEESYNESDTILAGREVVTADTPFGMIGLSICYDLRFPELYRELVRLGSSIFTVPAAFTYSTGRRHWALLLSARAVENLSFVIASNQGGQNTENRRTWGHSMIIDPWGNILAELEEGPGVACAELDMERLESLRSSFPALDHRIVGV